MVVILSSRKRRTESKSGILVMMISISLFSKPQTAKQLRSVMFPPGAYCPFGINTLPSASRPPVPGPGFGPKPA